MALRLSNNQLQYSRYEGGREGKNHAVQDLSPYFALEDTAGNFLKNCKHYAHGFSLKSNCLNVEENCLFYEQLTSSNFFKAKIDIGRRQLGNHIASCQTI